MRRYLAQITCVLVLLTPYAVGQQGEAPKIPVACERSTDSALPPKQPRPTAEEAEAATKAGRADPSFRSMEEPANFGVERYRIADYADCIVSTVCYWSDLAKEDVVAQAELKRLAATRKPGEKLAMVLDIDETSLSSYCEEKRESFGYIASMYNRWIVSPEASIPIPGTLELFKQARRLGVEVFFITGRAGVKGSADDQTEATERNLKAAGYEGWKGVILRDASERDMKTEVYKSSERAKIAQEYRILLNVGDQWSDLELAPKAEVSVKLPDPFYYIP